MKIHFDNVNFSSNSGPNSFGHRLADQLNKMGHEIVGPNDIYDVFLCFIEQTKHARPGAKKVLRLDGIWFSPDNFEKNNVGIKQSYYTFDHIVFQSEFDKNMIEKYFGKRSDCSVIHNGIQTNKVGPAVIGSGIEHLFVCSANWHRQKRLKENILLFREIQKEHPNSALYILGSGNTDDVHHMFDNGVVYVGQQPGNICLSLYAAADYFIHMAWLDHCPNVVVEALSQGCPVICTDSGGTSEIVKKNGVIIPEKTKYKYELLDYDNPFELDFANFKLPEENITVDSSHLNIEYVAERYLETFK